MGGGGDFGKDEMTLEWVSLYRWDYGHGVGWWDVGQSSNLHAEHKYMYICGFLALQVFMPWTNNSIKDQPSPPTHSFHSKDLLLIAAGVFLVTSSASEPGDTIPTIAKLTLVIKWSFLAHHNKTNPPPQIVIGKPLCCCNRRTNLNWALLELQ